MNGQGNMERFQGDEKKTSLNTKEIYYGKQAWRWDERLLPDKGLSCHKAIHTKTIYSISDYTYPVSSHLIISV